MGRSLISRLADLDADTVLETPPAELAKRTGMSEGAAKAIEELRRAFDPPAILDLLGREGVAVLTLSDEGYPERLKGAPDPPPALFVKGALPDVASVALVGSRKASSAGLETARDLSNKLLADGAGALWDVAEFADAIGPWGGGVPASQASADASETGHEYLPLLPDGLPSTEEAVLSGVGFEATGVDTVARRAGVEMRDALPALALLELKGYVTRDAVGAYARRALR